jgi:hypothetical protein
MAMPGARRGQRMAWPPALGGLAGAALRASGGDDRDGGRSWWRCWAASTWVVALARVSVVRPVFGGARRPCWRCGQLRDRRLAQARARVRAHPRRWRGCRRPSRARERSACAAAEIVMAFPQAYRFGAGPVRGEIGACKKPRPRASLAHRDEARFLAPRCHPHCRRATLRGACRPLHAPDIVWSHPRSALWALHPAARECVRLARSILSLHSVSGRWWSGAAYSSQSSRGRTIRLSSRL